MLWPACFEAQVANVHQLAPGPVNRDIATRELVVSLRDLEIPHDWVGERRDSPDEVEARH